MADDEPDGQKLLAITPRLQKVIMMVELPQAALGGLILEETQQNPSLRLVGDIPSVGLDATITGDLEVLLPPLPEFEIDDSDEAGAEAARWFEGTLHKRQQSLRRVLEVVVAEQASWLKGDSEEQKVVSEVSVARALGYQESTVRRVLGNKRGATPRGELSLGRLLRPA